MTTQPNQPLRECPFCGGKPNSNLKIEHNNHCYLWLAESAPHPCFVWEDFTQEWNTRSEPSPTRAQLLAELKECAGALKKSSDNGHALFCAAGDNLECLCGFDTVKQILSKPLIQQLLKEKCGE